MYKLHWIINFAFQDVQFLAQEFTGAFTESYLASWISWLGGLTSEEFSKMLSIYLGIISYKKPTEYKVKKTSKNFFEISLKVLEWLIKCLTFMFCFPGLTTGQLYKNHLEPQIITFRKEYSRKLKIPYTKTCNKPLSLSQPLQFECFCIYLKIILLNLINKFFIIMSLVSFT